MSKSDFEINEYHRKAFHWAETQKDGEVPTFGTRENDPYDYQYGFGNLFRSEGVPGTLPHGQTAPRKVRLGLYAEQLTGSSFINPRHVNKKTWLYRMRPAVAHKGYEELTKPPPTESCFLSLNPKVRISPTQLAWLPFDIPSEPTDFVDGLRSVAGAGDPSLREGIVNLVYVANTSMKRAFVNQDAEMLFVPQQGQLDVQTEFGKLWVAPGQILVVPRGIRFKVNLPDGPSRGYLVELYGSYWRLPDLGPLGGSGLADAKDFQTPVAYYETEKVKDYEIVAKVGGKWFVSKQDHSPFDVVAWSGNYVPYKYDLTKMVSICSASVDHIDPSIYCVLTADSRDPQAPLADFLSFNPRWDAASHTYRPPFYHRNVSSEYMGLIYGEYGGRSDSFLPGAISYETGMTPHGVAYPEFCEASKEARPVEQISLGSIMIMVESSRPFTITEDAFNSPKIHFHDPKMWDDLKSNFEQHLDEVKRLTNGHWEHGTNVPKREVNNK